LKTELGILSSVTSVGQLVSWTSLVRSGGNAVTKTPCSGPPRFEENYLRIKKNSFALLSFFVQLWRLRGCLSKVV